MENVGVISDPLEEQEVPNPALGIISHPPMLDLIGKLNSKQGCKKDERSRNNFLLISKLQK